MPRRPVLLVCLLAAAVGVPYVLLEKDLAATARGQWNRLLGKASPAPQNSAAASATPQGVASVALTAAPVGIEEAFRFDVKPSWVVSRFVSVSTVAGDARQLGMRVALVSGTRPDDVAGSLTYYFDDHHQAQRITFTGQTADARRLLAATVGSYGLQSQPTTEAALYVGGNPKQPSSRVSVRYLPLMQGPPTAPRVEVAVDLRRSDVVGWEQRQLDAGEPTLLPPSYRQW